MIDKEKILSEIESELSLIAKDNLYDEGRWNELNHLKLFINSLPEEPISEDLEEAADIYSKSVKIWNTQKKDIRDGYIPDSFKAGAQWQKERFNEERNKV